MKFSAFTRLSSIVHVHTDFGDFLATSAHTQVFPWKRHHFISHHAPEGHLHKKADSGVTYT